jgi:hypothetical protein
MASRNPGLYRSEVGNHIPTSSPRYGLKKGPISPKNGQKSPIIGIKSLKNHYYNCKNPHV